MRQLNVAGMLPLMLALSLPLSLRALAAGDGEGDANIVPVVTVAPTLFPAGQAANAYLCSLI